VIQHQYYFEFAFESEANSKPMAKAKMGRDSRGSE